MNKTDECYICAEKKRENPSLDVKAKFDEPTWHYAGFEYCYDHAKEKLVDMERRMMIKRVEANTVADDVKADEKEYRKSKIAAATALESAIFAKEQKEQFARAMNLIVKPVSEIALIKFEKQLGLRGGSGNYSINEVRKPGEGMGTKETKDVLKLIGLGAASVNFEFKSKGEEGVLMAVAEGKWKIHADCYPGTGKDLNFDAVDFYLEAESETFMVEVDVLFVDRDGKVKKSVKLLERDQGTKDRRQGGAYDLSLKDCKWTRNPDEAAAYELIQDYTLRFNVQLF